MGVWVCVCVFCVQLGLTHLAHHVCAYWELESALHTHGHSHYYSFKLYTVSPAAIAVGLSFFINMFVVCVFGAVSVEY